MPHFNRVPQMRSRMVFVCGGMLALLSNAGAQTYPCGPNVFDMQHSKFYTKPIQSQSGTHVCPSPNNAADKWYGLDKSGNCTYQTPVPCPGAASSDPAGSGLPNIPAGLKQLPGLLLQNLISA